MPKRRQRLTISSMSHDAADGYVIDDAAGVGYAIGARVVVEGPTWTAHVRTGATHDLQLALASVSVVASDDARALTPARLREIDWSALLDQVAATVAMPMRHDVVDGRSVVRFTSDQLASFDDDQRDDAVRSSRKRAGLQASRRSDDLVRMAELEQEAQALGISVRQHQIDAGPWSRATVDRLRKQLAQQRQDDVD